MEHSIDNVYYVNGLEYNFFRVYQIDDTGNEVKFFPDQCIVTNFATNQVVMSARRVKNINDLDFNSI